MEHTDISAIGDGTPSGAISELNTDFTNLKTKVDNSSSFNMVNVFGGNDLNALNYQLYKENSGKYHMQLIVSYGSTTKTIDLATWT